MTFRTKGMVARFAPAVSNVAAILYVLLVAAAAGNMSGAELSIGVRIARYRAKLVLVDCACQSSQAPYGGVHIGQYVLKAQNAWNGDGENTRPGARKT